MAQASTAPSFLPSAGSVVNASNELCNALPPSEPFEPLLYNNPAMLLIGDRLLFVHTAVRVYHPPSGKSPRARWSADMETLTSFRHGRHLAVFRSRLYVGWDSPSRLLAGPRHTDGALRSHGLHPIAHLGLPSLLYGAERKYDLDEIDDGFRPCLHGTMTVEGPSDARLFRFAGSVYVQYAAWQCYPEDGRRRDGRGKLFASQFLSRIEAEAGQMPQSQASSRIHVSGVGTSAQLTIPGPSQHQKNWMPWVHEDELYFSVFPEPHAVASVDVAHLASNCTIPVHPRYNTSHELLRSLQARWGKLSGGTPAIQAQCGSDEPVFLAIIHAKQAKSYANFAIAFSQARPFPVLNVSRMLPLVCAPRGLGPYGFNGSLRTARICFPTGIQIVDGHLFVAYGAGDAESRLWTIAWSTFCSDFLLAKEQEHLLASGLEQFFAHPS